MGFNKRKMENRPCEAADKEAAARRALNPQILEAAITAGYWFLHARCPASRTTGSVDLRTNGKYQSSKHWFYNKRRSSMSRRQCRVDH